MNAKAYYIEDGVTHAAYFKAKNWQDALEKGKTINPRFNIIQEDPYPNYGAREVIEYVEND